MSTHFEDVVVWRKGNFSYFRIPVRYRKEEDGSIWGYSPNLHGFNIHEKDFSKAIAKSKKVLRTLLETYLDEDIPIPWTDIEEKESDPFYTDQCIVVEIEGYLDKDIKFSMQ